MKYFPKKWIITHTRVCVCMYVCICVICMYTYKTVYVYIYCSYIVSPNSEPHYMLQGNKWKSIILISYSKCAFYLVFWVFWNMFCSLHVFFLLFCFQMKNSYLWWLAKWICDSTELLQRKYSGRVHQADIKLCSRSGMRNKR